MAGSLMAVEKLGENWGAVRSWLVLGNKPALQSLFRAFESRRNGYSSVTVLGTMLCGGHCRIFLQFVCNCSLEAKQAENS